jgi:hypothetical protein
MPYKTRKVRNQDCYRVYNSDTQKTFARCATRENALAQMKLLRGLQYSKSFRKRVTARRREKTAQK